MQKIRGRSQEGGMEESRTRGCRETGQYKVRGRIMLHGALGTLWLAEGDRMQATAKDLVLGLCSQIHCSNPLPTIVPSPFSFP